jgi:hypothetical protein
MSDELDDRLSQRFEGSDETDNGADSEQSESHPESDEKTSADTSQSDEKSQASQNAQNVKKDWNVRSFYLYDDLDDDLTMAFKRLDLELSETDAEINLKKTRHFYPLIVELGLEQLESMERTEVMDKLESTE